MQHIAPIDHVLLVLLGCRGPTRRHSRVGVRLRIRLLLTLLLCVVEEKVLHVSAGELGRIYPSWACTGDLLICAAG